MHARYLFSFQNTCIYFIKINFTYVCKHLTNTIIIFLTHLKDEHAVAVPCGVSTSVSRVSARNRDTAATRVTLSTFIRLKLVPV